MVVAIYPGVGQSHLGSVSARSLPVHEKDRKSHAGAKPFDVVLMFNVLVLQQLHNLSDDKIDTRSGTASVSSFVWGCNWKIGFPTPRPSGCFVSGSRA